MKKIRILLTSILFLFAAQLHLAYDAIAVVDRAVCSTSDTGGVNCTAAQLKSNINEETNAVDARSLMIVQSPSGTNNYLGSITPTLNAYADGNQFRFKPPNTNTGPSDLDVGPGVIPITSADGSTLGSGDLQSTTIYILQYFAANNQMRVTQTLGTGTASASGPFVTVGNSAGLSSERAITAGTAIDITDAGANSTVTVDVDLTELNSATLGAGSFTSLTFNAGAADPIFTFLSGGVIFSGITDFTLDNNAVLSIREASGNGIHSKQFQAPAAVTATTACVFEDDANFIPDSCVGDGSDDDVPDAADFTNLALTGDVTSVGLATAIAANSVALTTDTTGNYAAGDAEAGAALTGDTATAFFSAGTIEDARIDGSTEADELVLAGDVDGTANANDLDEANVETELEAVLDLPQMQGEITAANIAADAIALTTDTNGNYVVGVADGTGIDGTAAGEGATYTPTLDLTEINSAVFGAGAFTSLSFDAGAVDPVFNFASDTLETSAVHNIVFDDEVTLFLNEEDANGSNFISFKPPASIGTNRSCVLTDTAAPIPDSCVGDGVDAGSSGGISNVVEDASPTLGGDLEGGGFDLGTSASQADDIFLAEGSVINFDAGDLTITQTGNVLALGGGLLSGASVEAASATVSGGCELATTAEAEAHTDTTRCITPEGLGFKTESLCVAASNETTDLTTGTAKVTWRMPYAFVVSNIRGSVNDAAAGTLITVDINENGTTLMATNKLTIDIAEETSVTAATAIGLTDTNLADDAEMTADIDGVGTTAKGLKVCLIGHQ